MKNSMKVRGEKIYLTVPHQEGELTFQYPAFRGNLGNIANAIENDGLKAPNSSETISLVYDAFKNPGRVYESEIISILENYLENPLNNSAFQEFTGNLFLPKSNEEINNGIIIDNNPLIKNGKLIMNKNDLVSRLYENDPNVKFVPFGFKTYLLTMKEMVNNDYIKARYGEEGVEKLAEIAFQYGGKKHFLLELPEEEDEKESRSSLLCCSEGADYPYRGMGLAIGVDCDWTKNNLKGYTFGVVKD